MKRQLTYAAAIAALLLVGAGCAKQQAAVDLNAQPPGFGVQGKVEAADKVNAPATVNGTVDAILKDSEDEKTAQNDRESDASNINADDGELNAYSDTSYDLK